MNNAKYKYITKAKTILADLYTPVGVYMHLRDIYPQSALLESSDYHGNDNSRSFIGICPIANIKVGHGKIDMTFPNGTRQQSDVDMSQKGRAKVSVAKAINDFIHYFKVEGEGSNNCGLYGYTSFNAVRYFEDIPVKDATMDKNDAPDIMYILYRDILVFDHFNNTLTLISLCHDEAAGEANIDEIIKAINKQNINPYGFHAIGEPTSTLTDEEHKANIRKCIKHCLRGDVFQIVISRRFVQKYEGDDFRLYRSLRSLSLIHI